MQGKKGVIGVERKARLGRVLYIAVLIILILVFLLSGYMLIRYFAESQKSQQTYAQLQNLRGDYIRPTPGLPSPEMVATEPNEPALVTVDHPQTGQPVSLLPEFSELFLLNPDLVGWISIPGTDVDYPVVQRKAEKDHYLYRDFYGKQSSHGCVYAQENCDVAAPSDNVILYGHHMKDRSMFAQLADYQSKDFWQDHQYLYFDTLTERHTYQVISVFTTTASAGEGFSYHLFVDAADRDAFYRFLGGCNANRLYDTGLSAEYGDKLVCLSTCEYTLNNGRLVVVAKRIS